MLRDLSPEKAQELILCRVKPLPEEEASLAGAFRRVLAHSLAAPCPLPPFDRSPLDGYALQAADSAGASPSCPIRLRLLEEVPAGHLPALPLQPGCCTRVLTGAPLPAGANAVLPQEQSRPYGEEVEVLAELHAGENLSLAGEDVRPGEQVLAEGTMLNAGAIGLLAALGIANVPVFRRPRVAILTCGEELLPAGAPPEPGKIYGSNLYALTAAVLEAGGEPLPQGIVPDRLEQIVPALRQAAARSDLVVTSGGVSAGAYDLMPEAFQRLGGNLLFRRLACRPGRPVVWGEFAGLPLAGLSGNPASALLAFELLVRPLILRLGGNGRWQRPRLSGTLADDFPRSSAARRFLRAITTFAGERCIFHLAGGEGPGCMRSLAQANALLDIPAGSGRLFAGQKVEGLLLADDITA